MPALSIAKTRCVGLSLAATDCQPSSPTDCFGRLWSIQTSKETSPTSVLQNVEHTWDAAGNLTQRRNVLALDTETYSYGFLDRLTSVGR